MDFKNIHIGDIIKRKVTEDEIEISRICKYLQCTENEVMELYAAKSMDTEILLKWSKLLRYDFFRIYNQHLILFAPQTGDEYQLNARRKSSLPRFRKNIYTKEIIDFILELIDNNKKSKNQIIKEYNIPKSTVSRWILKHQSENKKED